MRFASAWLPAVVGTQSGDEKQPTCGLRATRRLTMSSAQMTPLGCVPIGRHAGQRLGGDVRIIGLYVGVRNVGRRTVSAGFKDAGFETQPRSRDRQHAAQLAAAKDADGRARLQRHALGVSHRLVHPEWTP